jgi:hypothetical protein
MGDATNFGNSGGRFDLDFDVAQSTSTLEVLKCAPQARASMEPLSPAESGDHMQLRNSPNQFGVIAISFHWVTVTLVLLARTSVTFGDELR